MIFLPFTLVSTFIPCQKPSHSVPDPELFFFFLIYTQGVMVRIGIKMDNFVLDYKSMSLFY